MDESKNEQQGSQNAPTGDLSSQPTELTPNVTPQNNAQPASAPETFATPDSAGVNTAGRQAQATEQMPPYQGGYNPNQKTNSVPPMSQHNPYDTSGQATTNGKAIAALICGIAAIVLCFLPFISIPCAIAGIILSRMAKKEQNQGGGMALGGLVCSIIGGAVSVMILIVVLLAGAFFVKVFSTPSTSGYTSIAPITSSSATASPSSSSAATNSNSTSSSSSAASNNAAAPATNTSADQQAGMTAAQQEFDRLIARDAAMIQEMARELDEEMRDETEDMYGGWGYSLTDIGINPTDLANWMLDGMTYKVDSAQVKSWEGEMDVWTTVHMRDVRTFAANWRSNMLGKARWGASLDQVRADVTNAVNMAKQQTAGYVDKPYKVECHNVGGTWRPEYNWYDDLVEDAF